MIIVPGPYPCHKASCEHWDSDKNGGHCMLVNPECPRVQKIRKKLKKKEKAPR